MTVSFVVLIGAILLCVPIRIWQYLYLIDPQTGFYMHDHFTVGLLAILLLVAAVLITVFTLREKNLMETPMQYGTKALGVTYILLSGCMTYSCVQKVLLLIGTTKTTKDIIYAVITLLCALSFIVLAFLFIAGKTQNTLTRILLIVPVVWSIGVLWNTFIGYQTILTISEHLLEIIAFILIVLYNLSFAFVVSGFGGASHQKRMVIYGCIGAIFCVLNAVAKIYISLKTHTNVSEIMPTYLLYLSFGIFMIVSIGYICFGTDRSISMSTYDDIFAENIEIYNKTGFSDDE